MTAKEIATSIRTNPTLSVATAQRRRAVGITVSDVIMTIVAGYENHVRRRQKHGAQTGSDDNARSDVVRASDGHC